MTDAPCVLVCDDEPQVLHALTTVLSGGGFEAITTSSAEEALDRVAVQSPDAAIVDLMLPGENGAALCRRLREWSTMPILVLSAIDDEREKISALRAGADDYITKPFSPRELIARLEAALRRARRSEVASTLVLGELEIDLAGHIVRSSGREIRLTPIEYELLRTLAVNAGKVMVHRALLLEVWGATYEADISTLRFHIASLRRKIDQRSDGVSYIRTLVGVGYQFGR